MKDNANAILISIKPKYARKILDGTKKYEFRKGIFKRIRKWDSIAYIYESSPTKRIVGKFVIARVFRTTTKTLWEKFHEHAGITEDEFFEYYKGKKCGHAIMIKDVIKFTEPIDPRQFISNFHAPQSFSYLDQDAVSLIEGAIA